jgi:hypothetical protein
MYDAWAAYDTVSDQVLHHERLSSVDAEAARAQAISFAAYRVLKHRFLTGPGAVATQAALDAQMDALGYDRNFVSTVGNTPAALGNRVAASVIAAGFVDGSNEAGNYAPTNGYVPINEPLIIALPGTVMVDPNHWQPLAFDYYVKQNGQVVGAAVQAFVCPHWLAVTPFSLVRSDMGANTYFDPGPPPRLGSSTDAQFKAEVIQVIRFSSRVDPTDGVMIDISPSAIGNNPVGEDTGTGHALNPVTGLPYPPNIVKRADYGRILAEFWADGPDSETPPGHWHVLANYVSDHPQTVKRIGGEGPIVNDLEWDVKKYLAISGAGHDAAIGAWGCKGEYDSSRPISMIRYMGGLGQCTDLRIPSYHPMGLPLVADLIELVTPATTMPGQRHAHLAGHEGEIAIFAWLGQPADPKTQIGGVGWLLAEDWSTYQAITFVTPPFAGYTSGHSTFSRAAAEVMTGFTGSEFFPGGYGEFVAHQSEFLEFEQGPSQTVTLQWATYFDSADEAGISRLWGGIHVKADDKQGRIMGATIGKKVYEHARDCFRGQASCPANLVATPGVPQEVGIDDLLAVVNDWGPCPSPCPVHCNSDINNDCQVGIDDLLSLINSWGPCP